MYTLKNNNNYNNGFAIFIIKKKFTFSNLNKIYGTF